jgi:hypothetical protein
MSEVLETPTLDCIPEKAIQSLYEANGEVVCEVQEVSETILEALDEYGLIASKLRKLSPEKQEKLLNEVDRFRFKRERFDSISDVIRDISRFD